MPKLTLCLLVLLVSLVGCIITATTAAKTSADDYCCFVYLPIVMGGSGTVSPTPTPPWPTPGATGVW